MLNGTVRSRCTDPTQATARLVIVLESRIQKSGSRDNSFVKWKGTFRSVGPKWPGRSKWTTFKAGLEYCGQTKPKWSVSFDVPTEMRPWLHGLVLSCSMTTRLFWESAAYFIGYYDVVRKNGSESVP